jgi:hypothetical protein
MSNSIQRKVTRNLRLANFGVKHRIGNGKAGRTTNAKCTSASGKRHTQNYVQVVPIMEVQTIDDRIQHVQVGEKQIKHRR